MYPYPGLMIYRQTLKIFGRVSLLSIEMEANHGQRVPEDGAEQVRTTLSSETFQPGSFELAA